MRKYIMMGVQGSGKGTQANLLARNFDLVHISVGDIFRWNVQNHTKSGARIKRIVSDGNLVPDSIVEEVVKTRLDQHDWNYGFILDGFPRNHAQAQFFLESYDIDAAILLDVPDAVVSERMMARRLCSHCGIDYNLIFHRPAQPDICDVCGNGLTTRPDDTPAAIRNRLEDYHTKTQPIIDLFRRKELVVVADGTQDVNAVQEQIRERLGLGGSPDYGAWLRLTGASNQYC
jgi:adenylate kinase